MLAICSVYFWFGWVLSLYSCFKFTCTNKDRAQNVFHVWYVFQWDDGLLSIVLTATCIMKLNFSCRLKLILGEILIKANPRIDLWNDELQPLSVVLWIRFDDHDLCLRSQHCQKGHIESWIFLVYNPGWLALQMGAGIAHRAPDSWLKGRGFELLTAGEFSSPGSTFCADSQYVPPPCYRSSTSGHLPKVQVAGYS